jgi:hypothetical protein
VLSFWKEIKTIPHFPSWVTKEFRSPSNGVGVEWQLKFFGYHSAVGACLMAINFFLLLPHIPPLFDGNQLFFNHPKRNDTKWK